MTRTLYKSRRSLGIKSALDRWIFKVLRNRSNDLLSMRGQRMAVFANDYIGNKINLHGIYEKEELDALREFLSPIQHEIEGGVALDIGANIGNHAIYLSDMFKSIHSFEPNPYTFRLLEFNLSFVENAHAYQYGLGDVGGSFQLVECENNLGKSSISETSKSTSITVNVSALDDLEISSSKIVFIKIDVEGLEEKVLMGGHRTISSHKPIIAFEQHRDDFGVTGSASVSFLLELGYKMCWFEGRPDSHDRLSKIFHDIKAALIGSRNRIVTGDQVPPKFHNMLIAVPPQFHSQLQL